MAPSSADGTLSFCGGRLFFLWRFNEFSRKKKKKDAYIYQLAIAGCGVEICTQFQYCVS